MLNEQNCINIIEFPGRKADWESWFESSICMVKIGVIKSYCRKWLYGLIIPFQKQCANALKGDEDLNKIVKVGEVNELTYEDLILSIDSNFSMVKLEFGLERNAKSLEFSKENCKVECDWLMNKCAPHNAWTLLKVNNEFHNKKLESIEKEPDEWISHLKG